MHAAKKVRRPLEAPNEQEQESREVRNPVMAAPGLVTFPGPGASRVRPHVGQKVPGLEHHVGDPNKGVTSKGHTISYRKNNGQF